MRELKPDVYGLSFASPFAQIVTRLLAEVRVAAPHTLIVCGGAHPTIAAEEVLVNTPADCCCVGEGEVTFPELIQAWLNEDDFAGVPGLAIRKGDGTVHVTEKRQAVRSLDEMPRPDYTASRTSLHTPGYGWP